MGVKSGLLLVIMIAADVGGRHTCVLGGGWEGGDETPLQSLFQPETVNKKISILSLSLQLTAKTSPLRKRWHGGITSQIFKIQTLR